MELNKVDTLRYNLLESAMHYSYYWAKITDASEHKVEFTMQRPFAKDGYLVFEDVEQDDAFEPVRLDRKALVRGWKVMQADYPRHYKDAIEENDDAITGDVYLQCCLFGKVIFG